MNRTFSNLLAHTKIKIRYQVWILDSWDSEYFYIYLDDVLGLTIF